MDPKEKNQTLNELQSAQDRLTQELIKCRGQSSRRHLSNAVLMVERAKYEVTSIK